MEVGEGSADQRGLFFVANIYIKMLPEYKGWIFLEDEALRLKGKWRGVFQKNQPLDLEIGCGNGFFFAHQVETFPKRNLLGLELKYKPLVQTVRRVRKKNLGNGRGIRFHAGKVSSLFERGEIENVYIHFPDPWPKRRHQKNRLVNREFLDLLRPLQNEGAFVDFKTDSKPYFEHVCREVPFSPYKINRYSLDLHQSEWAGENFVTSFERIFSKKNQPIYYMRLGHQ